jgi:hypothetical protein
MHGPKALDLAETAPTEHCGLLDRLAGGTQCDDAVVGSGVGAAPGVFASYLRQPNALALPFAASFIVVTCHLQGQSNQQLLHGFEDDSCHSVGPGRQIHKARNYQLCTLASDRGYQILGFGER